LNVPAEVRDLFQYIERYKPQEVELETPLRCFIPEFIPAIGELDPFIKIPRPDKKEDGSGLRYLAEPAANQSDPTVLELQLRAKSKKLQYGDVAVRSIENADKYPQKVEKWIQDIHELHRSKPPPQVNYKKNMPDIDHLMEAWPEEFETLLQTTPLPSPDLELSLLEYVKSLCAILDIPVYDNPVESLHLLFSLYIEFKNNPHFQSRLPQTNNELMANGSSNQADTKNGMNNDRYTSGAKYGGADILEIAEYK
jgi:intraflagellar transport protein 46